MKTIAGHPGITMSLLLIALIALGGENAAAQQASGIYKCVIAGKTVYSDTTCGKPGTAKEVELHHAKGIVGPDRQTIDDTRARIQDQMWVDDGPGRTTTRTITRNGQSKSYTVASSSPTTAMVLPTKNEQCAPMARRITELEAMARQPQSGQMQDWIKAEKTKTQTQASTLQC